MLSHHSRRLESGILILYLYLDDCIENAELQREIYSRPKKTMKVQKWPVAAPSR